MIHVRLRRFQESLMPVAASTSDSRTLADLLELVGDVPLARIRRPIGDATEDDVIRLLDGDDKHICELIDGVLVEKTMGSRESMIAAIVGRLLGNFVDEHHLGFMLTTDGPIRIRAGRIRFPDTCFVSWSQFPDGELPEQTIWDAIPDLAVEVISEGNTRREMELKLADYFAAGVKLVWYLYPKTKSAVAYTSPTRKKEVAPTGSLDGGKVLPGFSLPLADVFAPPRRPKRLP